MKVFFFFFLAFTEPTAVINLSKAVDQEFTTSEVAKIIQNIAEEYGVQTHDIDANIEYEVSGSFKVENADSTPADIIEETVKTSISQQTGIPVGDIHVDYNSDTGLVEYTIDSDSYNASNDIRESINDQTFSDTIEDSLENVDSNIDVTSPQVNDSVEAAIEIFVDGKNASVDMNTATNNLITEFSDDGFTVERADGIPI